MDATTRGSEGGKSVNKTTVERSSDRELLITRSFNAPPRIVFDAWTKPELLKRWWAPKALGVTLFTCDADLRVGGRYRYVVGHDEAKPLARNGWYKELVPYTRLVYTQIFEPMPEAGEGVITTTFEDISEGSRKQTRVVSRELFPTKEVLEGVLASGMEKGMRATLEQLEELVATLG
jgi:uncharacterized protein YndB with AHSA1/START domain